MSAETLRRAATKLRSEERRLDGRSLNLHPDAALALADWLDSTANDVQHVHTPIYNLTSTTVARALAAARAYLEESAG